MKRPNKAATYATARRGESTKFNTWLWRGEAWLCFGPTNAWLCFGPTNTWLCLDPSAGCYGAYSGRHRWRGNTKVADHQSPLLSVVVLLVDHVITASLTSMVVWSIPLYSHETRCLVVSLCARTLPQ